MVQGHADPDPVLTRHVRVEHGQQLFHLRDAQADLRLAPDHEVVGVGRTLLHRAEARRAERGHQRVQIGHGVLKAEDVSVRHGVTGEGHKAGAGERLEAVGVALGLRLAVAVGAAHKRTDALAAGRVLGVRLAGDALDLWRQLTLRVDAVVEVKGSDAELWHEGQTDAGEAATRSRVTRSGEGGHTSAIINAALLAVALPAVGVIWHLQRLAVGVVGVLLKPPDQPAL